MSMRYIPSDTLSLDAALCTGCGRCADVCPHAVFRKEGRVFAIADKGRCMECGACMENCPFSAVKVEKGTGCAQAILSSKKTGKVTCGCDSGSCC